MKCETCKKEMVCIIIGKMFACNSCNTKKTLEWVSK